MTRIFVLLLLLISKLEALELGAGYNEQLANIYNPLIVKSGSKWARAYVNVTRNYMTYANPVNTAPPNPINGYIQANIYQYPAHVSSDADVLAISVLDNLVFTKTQSVGLEPVKIILSLKHDFTYPYQNVAPYGSVPDTESERQFLFDAIQGLLETNSRGQYIDILVVGNEPMFEMQPNTDPDTATRYIEYLDFLIPRLVALKASKGWAFAI